MEHYSDNKILNQRKGKAEGWHLAFWVALFAVAYIARDLVPIRVPDILFTGICAIAFVLLDLEGSLGLYIFTSVLTVPDFEIRIVYICVMAAKYILQKKKVNVVMLISVLFLVLLELVNVMMFSKEEVYKLLWSFGSSVTYMLLPVFWVTGDHSPEGYDRAMLCYIAGSLLGGIVLLIITANMVGWDVLLESEQLRLGLLDTTDNITGTTRMQTTYNANQLAIMQAISTTMVIILMYKKTLPKAVGILLLLPMAVIILFTKSRTGTLLFALPILIYFLFIIIKEKRIWQGLIVAVAVLLLLVIVQKYFPVVWRGLWDRFKNEEDISGGRTGLNATYFAKWSSDIWCLLFGYGIGAYRKVVGMGTSPHNGFVDILISSGLVGLISLCVQWVTLFRYGAQNVSRKTYLIAFLPVIIAVVESFAGQYLTLGYPHIRMCFLLLAAASFAIAPEKRTLRRKI